MKYKFRMSEKAEYADLVVTIIGMKLHEELGILYLVKCENGSEYWVMEDSLKKVKINMLKIRNNINLKELKKFGFEYDEYSKCYVKQIFSQHTKGAYVPFVATGYLILQNDGTFIDYLTNKYVNAEKEHKESLNKVYDDLIKANLVREVKN